MIRDRILAVLRWAILVGLVALSLLVMRGWALGQDVPPAERPELVRRLALDVAKVAANEASLSRVRPAEVALVWQVTEARGETTAARLAWLRAHSSCVLTDRERTAAEMRGNCAWSRGLRDDDTRPEGWPDRLAWERYAPRWAQVRTLALRLVRGESTLRPCPRAPWTWGGRRIDMQRALDRGLVPLGCRSPITGEPTINEGFALAGDAS